jgi:hypothetical protein
MKAVVALAAVFAGCSSAPMGVDGAPSAGDDAGGPPSGDPGAPCAIGLTSTPIGPTAGPTATVAVAATVTSGNAGLPTYTWSVQFGAAPVAITARPGGAAIQFATPDPGIYDVSVGVSGEPAGCTSAALPINVGVVGANTQLFRLRVVPRADVAVTPLDRQITVRGGASADLGAFSLEMPPLSTFQVTGPAGPLAAYVRLAPVGDPDRFVEAFSVADPQAPTGVRLSSEPQTARVIPSSGDLAPRLFTGISPDFFFMLALDRGTPITGTVRDPGDAALAGATVQLSIAGVPSTVATTGPDGSFTLAAALDGTAGSAVTVDVAAPAGSGLPRLSATSTAFQLDAGLVVRYAHNIAPVPLDATRVARKTQAVGSAPVMIVGSLPAAGTIATGAVAPVTAAGDIRIAAATDPTGALAGVRVPPALLSAVVTVASGDLAVAALDTTLGAPARLEAPRGPSIGTAALGPVGADGLPGAALDLVPVGALAAAGAPELHAIAGPGGAITTVIASGGHYDLRFRDPQNRAAAMVVADRDESSIATSYRLPPALGIRGSLVGGLEVLPGATVQVLCSACTGIDRDRPIAEAVSDGAGRFVVVIPDPGTR